MYFLMNECIYVRICSSSNDVVISVVDDVCSLTFDWSDALYELSQVCVIVGLVFCNDSSVFSCINS